MTEQTEKYEQEKPERSSKFVHKSYFASKEDLKNPALRHGDPRPGAYKNISAWRK